uniref:outer membrane beta-barrel protein n=1 Tax=Roseivirga sp. TaxID=1964215 RepID=UPI0040471CC7
MKRLVLATALLMMSTLSFAQITKGDIQLGGMVNFSKVEAPGFERSNFTLTPRAGLFVSDLTSVGITTGFTSSKLNGAKSNLFQFGVYTRFHKMVAEQFYIYLQPSLAFGTGSAETGNGPDADITSFNIGIAPGMTYFLSPKFALEMNFGSLAYNSTTNEISGVENKTENYGLNLNFDTITLGFSYYIK